MWGELRLQLVPTSTPSLLLIIMNKTKLKERIKNLEKGQKKEHSVYRQAHIDKFKERLKQLENEQNK